MELGKDGITGETFPSHPSHKSHGIRTVYNCGKLGRHKLLSSPSEGSGYATNYLTLKGQTKTSQMIVTNKLQEVDPRGTPKVTDNRLSQLAEETIRIPNCDSGDTNAELNPV